MTRKDAFQARFPRTYILDPGDLPALANYLSANGRLATDDMPVDAAKAGEGNISCVVRVAYAEEMLASD